MPTHPPRHDSLSEKETTECLTGLLRGTHRSQLHGPCHPAGRTTPVHGAPEARGSHPGLKEPSLRWRYSTVT